MHELTFIRYRTKTNDWLARVDISCRGYDTRMQSQLFPAVIALVGVLAGQSIAAAAGGDVIPAGTRVHFHLTEAVSSAHSRSGQPFTFVLSEPLVVDGRTIAAQGSTGRGTLLLAGHAGPGGHEGDLTLRLDHIQTSDEVISFQDQRFEVNGPNKKIASAALGFVPIVGLAAHFIRGSEIRVDPATPLETVLVHPAGTRSLARDAVDGSSSRALP